MKKFPSLLLAILLIAVLMLTQPGCEVSGGVEVSGSGSASGSFGDDGFSGEAKGEVKVGASIKITFSPKPTVFDEAIVLDLNQGLNVLDNSFAVKVSIKTDTGFTKTATFTFNRDSRMRLSPKLSNARTHGFKPANKAALDKFIADALGKTNHVADANISFTFKYQGQFQRTSKEKLALTSKDIGVRAKFIPNQTPQLLRMNRVNVPLKAIR